METMTATTARQTDGGVSTTAKVDALGRRTLSGAERQRLLEEYRASGQSAAEFARARGLGYTTLCGWLQQERAPRTARKAKEPRLKVLDTAPLFTAKASDTLLLEVIINGILIKIHRP